jgi:hypothetical protein
VTAQDIVSDLEQPRPKKPALADLPSLPINREHNFLRKIFSYREFTTPCPEKRDQLRRKNPEQFCERLFVWIVQELIGDCAF